MPEFAQTLFQLMSVPLAAYFGYLFASRSSRNEAINRFKEEKYAKLLVKLQGFVGNTVSGQTKREFLEEQYQSWLYASDEVVEAINRLLRFVIESRENPPSPEDGRRLIGELVLAMRKDLLRSTALPESAFRYTDVNK
jgi:hypothetical protein